MNILRAGDPTRKKLDLLQSQIGALRKEIEAVASTPLALDEARALVRAAVKQRIGKSHPINLLHQFRARRVDPRIPPPMLPTQPDWGMLVLLLGEQEIENRLASALEIIDAEKPGMSTAERDKRLEELRKQMHELERKEEMEVLRLEDERYDVVRRADANPEVLLEVWQGAA